MNNDISAGFREDMFNILNSPPAREAVKILQCPGRVRVRVILNPKSEIPDPKSIGPGKLAAWISASHVEKAPKKKVPPTPPVPPTP